MIFAGVVIRDMAPGTRNEVGSIGIFCWPCFRKRAVRSRRDILSLCGNRNQWRLGLSVLRITWPG